MSSPASSDRRDTCWPCTKRYSSASSGGTANSIAIASSVSRSTALTCSGWMVARRCAASASGVETVNPSVLLEVREGLAALRAGAHRLALRRAEMRHLTGARRAAQRADDRELKQLEVRAEGSWRGDGVLAELAASVVGHPVGRPRRREDDPHRDVLIALRADGSLHVLADHLER